MQHVVNLAFDFDDEKAKAAAEKAVSTELDSIIKNIVLDRIAPETDKWNAWRERKFRDWARVESAVDTIVKVIIEENKDMILDLAATKLADSVKRTKKWKETYTEVIDNETNS